MYRSDMHIGDGENNEEIIYSRDPKIVNYSWTKEATRLLIAIRAQLDTEFDDPNQRKMDLWEKISLALKENGFEFPPSICDKKWRNLLVSFRRTISRGTQGKLGRFPYTWEFYEDLLAYWQKKDPVGIRNLTLSAQNGGEHFQEDEENMEELDHLHDDPYEDGDLDDNGDGGDLNKFLSVTLTESDDDGPQPENCVVGRRGDIEIRPHIRTPKIDNLEISALPYSPNFKVDSPPMLANRKFPMEVKSIVNNRSNKFRPTPTITIEEVPPRKRKIEEDDSSEIQALGINNPHLNISLRESMARSENSLEDHNTGGAPSSKLQRRNDSEDLSSPPNDWLLYFQKVEASAQKRWEITESRQIREYKQKRELDLQLLQTLQNLSSVLVKMTEEA